MIGGAKAMLADGLLDALSPTWTSASPLHANSCSGGATVNVKAGANSSAA